VSPSTPAHRGEGLGERLLASLEQQAKAAGMGHLLALTTGAEHWFARHGFEQRKLEDLPANRRKFYNFQRKAKIFGKKL